MADVPISRQVAEIERELALRRRVYPKWVESGRLGDIDAQTQIAEMEAALKTLQWVERNGPAIKVLAAQLKAGNRPPTEAERDAPMSNDSVRALVESFPQGTLRISNRDALDEMLEGDDG